MVEKNKNILVLGYGEMGHTMELLLAKRHNIAIWDPYYPGKLDDIDLDAAAGIADFVIFCTPTVALYELALRIAPQLPVDCICLSMAKSLDTAGRTPPEALGQGLAESSDYAFLYGPMISEEIIADKPGFAMLATDSSPAMASTQALFSDTFLKLKPFQDINGAAWCAVLKNVYALLFGMADELRLGDNMRGFLMVQSLAELAEIMTLKQGEPETPYTLAGLGDLVTTATSEDSHHHALGAQLARNEREKIGGEGVNTLNTVVKLKLLDTDTFPLFKIVEQVVLNDADPQNLLSSYIDEHLT